MQNKFGELIREHWLKGGVILIILFGLLSFILKGNDSDLIEPSAHTRDLSRGEFSIEDANLVSSEEVDVSDVFESVMYVDIKGAINKPGMYQFTGDTRVQDIVNLAGGFTDSADKVQVNLAQKVVDQMVIYVPKEGEDIVNQQNVVDTNSEEASDKSLININTASLTELQTLTGVGAKKAQAIIDYREEHGSFKLVDDLKNVSGIGEKIFESLREFITI